MVTTPPRVNPDYADAPYYVLGHISGLLDAGDLTDAERLEAIRQALADCYKASGVDRP